MSAIRARSSIRSRSNWAEKITCRSRFAALELSQLHVERLTETRLEVVVFHGFPAFPAMCAPPDLHARHPNPQHNYISGRPRDQSPGKPSSLPALLDLARVGKVLQQGVADHVEGDADRVGMIVAGAGDGGLPFQAQLRSYLL